MTAPLIAPLIPPRARPGAREHGKTATARPLAPAVPPYRQMAAILKRRILSAQYLPESRVPTESELFETYEVARTTARPAVGVLPDEGLVYTVPQRGTYVAQQTRGEYRTSRQALSFSQPDHRSRGWPHPHHETHA